MVWLQGGTVKDIICRKWCLWLPYSFEHDNTTTVTPVMQPESSSYQILQAQRIQAEKLTK